MLSLKKKLCTNFAKLLALLLVFYSFPTVAQTYENIQLVDYATPRKYEVVDIKIVGVRYLDQNALIQLSGLTKGQTIEIPGDETTRAIEKLWKQGLFSEVKVLMEKLEGNKINLVFQLQERPRVSKLVFKGVKKADEKKINDILKIIPGAQVTDNLILTAKKRIKDFYIDKGYLYTQLDVLQKVDSIMPNGVILIMNVDKGRRTRISEIIVDGNQELSDKTIRKTLKETKTNKWYNFLKASKFVDKEFREDLKKVVAKYNEKGFRDAKILNDSISLDEDQNLHLHLNVYEGHKYFFGNIQWVGNTKFTPEQLTQVLSIKRGDVYDKKILDKRLTSDDDAVSNLYLDDGYLFFNLHPVELSFENDTINFEMRIFEGKQATINRIIINGNTKTNEHVIRRELRTRPGQLFSKTAIMRTVRELAQLGHFDPEKLDVKPIPNQADGTVDLEYVVEERANDQIEISGGWGSGQIVGTVGLRFNNFSTGSFTDKKSWRPLPSGDGQQLNLRIQSNGKWYQSYSLSFVEPWLGGKKPNALSFSLYHTIQKLPDYTVSDVLYSNPEQTVTGASLGIGVRLTWPDDYFQMRNEISYRRYKMNNWSYSIFANGESNDFSFVHTIARNSVDNPLYSRGGSSFKLTLSWTPPYSLLTGKDYSQSSDAEKFKWLEYHKWEYEMQWFTRIAGDLILMSKGTFGFVGYYNKDIGPTPFGKYKLGGDGMSGYSVYGIENVALRGYQNSSLSPNTGDNLYNKFTMEIRYPLSLNPSATVYGLAFAEGGKSWEKFEDYNPFGMYRSLGVGVRMFLPMLGMIGIDWGYGFDAVPDNPSANGSQWHFVLGQQF